MAGALLHCPIRGSLNVPEKAADGLTFTEEKQRIDCIKFLLAKGYPPTHFKIETVLHKFGNKGRNSFRTDLAILDAPVASLPNDIEALKPHIKLVAEIKRDNADAKLAKQTQVKPALDFLQNVAAYGIYWDNIEQRWFYRTLTGTVINTHETAASLLPKWGDPPSAPRLRCADLRTTNLRDLFIRIEDMLHTEVVDHSRRFEIMLQLLLVKLYDEHVHRNPQQEMSIQDYGDIPLADADVKAQFEGVLTRSVSYYGKYLPKPVAPSFSITGAMLRIISSLLAPVKVLGSKRTVVQDFYMYFAKGVYKWDLAQYFTPPEVVDFVVKLTNPRAGEQVKDPACGSGDFLVSSLRYAQDNGEDLHDAVWGTDNSENAVQVCVLNMVLNGDGKSNIKEADSLFAALTDAATYEVLLCNPPFGVKIRERRFDVLKQFELGHEWTQKGGRWEQTKVVLKDQQVGILFAELCIKQAANGGRVGIILPNGYLGNKSAEYVLFREWLLRHARLVAVVACPRFTFKKSGADVSASVLILEKRSDVLNRAVDSEDYPFYAGIIEAVGYSISDNKADLIYKRDADTGALLTDVNNEPIQDADFGRVLQDLWASQVASDFAWITRDVALPANLTDGWSVNIREALQRPDISIDAKRWCERATTVRKQIENVPHFALRDVVDVIAQERVSPNASAEYDYIQLDDVSDGVVTPERMRGWQLPDRGKHRAQQGDIFVGGIWGSVGKWFVAAGDCKNLVVSNGLIRLRLKPDRADCLLDIVAGLNTEAYRIQARSYCTGSDGLAELSDANLLEIVLPRITDSAARTTLQPIVDALLAGRATVESAVATLLKQGQIPNINVSSRTTGKVQV